MSLPEHKTVVLEHIKSSDYQSAEPKSFSSSPLYSVTLGWPVRFKEKPGHYNLYMYICELLF